MKDNCNPRTGTFTIDNQTATFYLDDFLVTFMSPDRDMHNYNDNQFIFGETYNGHDIAIFKGKSTFEIEGVKRLNTSAYIVATDNLYSTNWDTFDYIEFIGGTLNQLFFCTALKGNLGSDTEKITFQDDSLHFIFSFGAVNCEIIVESTISEQLNGGGRNIKNNTVSLTMKFSSPQKFVDAFEHITKIKDMMSIMTYRENVGFEEIYLHHNNPRISKMQVFLKENFSLTNKNIYDNLTFHDLHNYVPNLLTTIYSKKDNEASYDIGFIPLDDKEVYQISNQKVRMICSALECELFFIDDISYSDQENLSALVNEIKEKIKEHRESSNKLSPKTYDMIFGSIKNWSMSASDKIWTIFQRYEEVLSFLLKGSDVIISEREITAFIKYRNNITHGSHRVINKSIANTAYILSGLIYCCLLTRIGMSKDEIITMCKNNKLLS